MIHVNSINIFHSKSTQSNISKTLHWAELEAILFTLSHKWDMVSKFNLRQSRK